MDKENLYYLVSQNIKKQRKIKGWTQVKLAMTATFGWVPPDFSRHSCHYFLYLNVFSASSLLSLLALLTAIILHNIEIVNKI